MRYESKEDLPETVADVLPEEAKQIYIEAYDRTWEIYDELATAHVGRHGAAHRQGWAAVERAFTRDTSTGKWHRKGAEAEEKDANRENKEGLLDKVRGAIRNVIP